jgi:glycosyltransferase involved in cell wall biosynthesis
MRSRRTLLVAAQPHDLSDAPYDGFVHRRHEVMQGLRERFDVRIVLLRRPQDEDRVHDDYGDDVCGEVAVEVPDTNRSARLRRAAAPDADAPHAAALRALVARAGAGAAVTFGPWLDVEYAPVFATLPTVHFFEEDLSAMVEIAPQSRRARAFRHAERRLRAHRSRVSPRAVACISATELRPAERIWPRADVFWHPFVLDPSRYPVAETPSDGSAAICLGQFREPRNAEGLAAVARHLSPPPPVVLASGAGVHASLEPFAADGRLVLATDTGDAYALLRGAALTLVPALRVTGVKTTVLQAWAAGCPVVCFPASARSIGPFADEGLELVRTAEEAARAVRRLAGDEPARERLAATGAGLLRRHFDSERTRAALAGRVEALVGRA